jgi:hypothetical protein
MEFIDQYYAIVAQHKGYSNRDGSAMTTITMWGLDDGKTYTTYIVDSYRNAQNWGYITRNPEYGFMIKFFNGRYSKDLQINADSIPQLQEQTESPGALKDVFRRIWAERGTPTTKSKVTRDQLIAEALEHAEQVVNKLREAGFE